MAEAAWSLPTWVPPTREFVLSQGLEYSRVPQHGRPHLLSASCGNDISSSSEQPLAGAQLCPAGEGLTQEAPWLGAILGRCSLALWDKGSHCPSFLLLGWAVPGHGLEWWQDGEYDNVLATAVETCLSFPAGTSQHPHCLPWAPSPQHLWPPPAAHKPAWGWAQFGSQEALHGTLSTSTLPPQHLF